VFKVSCDRLLWILAEENAVPESGELLDVTNMESDASDSGDEMECDAELTTQQRTVFNLFHILLFDISHMLHKLWIV